ncbi:YhdP family protein [Rhodocyclaceae bacterium SMB388]
MPSRWTGMLMNVFVLAFFLAGLLLLVIREVFIPGVHDYRPQIERALGRAIGMSVGIESLSADWQGLRPRFHVSGLSVLDAQGATEFRLERVDAVLSWSSLLSGQIRFHQFVVDAPHLGLRRDADGRIFVAGVPVGSGAAGSGFVGWALSHREVMIWNASVRWTDALRGAPALELDSVDLRLTSVGGRHRFAVRTRPPIEIGGKLEIRGDLVGGIASDPSDWTGQVHVAIDDVDLAGLRPWFSPPVLQGAFGSLHAWLDVDAGRLMSIDTELAMVDGLLRLDDERPELAFEVLRGRIAYRPRSDGFELATSELEIRAGESIRLVPLTLELNAVSGADRPLASGSLSVNRVDLDVLAGWIAHYPLAETARSRIEALRPAGTLTELHLEWRDLDGHWPQWKVRTQFDGIAWRPSGTIPGVDRISGELNGDQVSGRFRLDSRDAAIEMPRVLPEPVMRFSTLQADGGWTRHESEWAFSLDGLRFENPDAAGSGSGTYRTVGGGRGEIDIAARLTRADGAAVWRYMPLQVNARAREWLRNALIAGAVPDARLRLRGNLADFPFEEGRGGQFLVTVRVGDASLRYGELWPAIEGINGEIRFEGSGMRMSADSGRILGVELLDVIAEVPRLGAPEGGVMTLTGRAQGATPDFLAFIAESPLHTYLGGFTDHIRAAGSGDLDLTLVLPLSEILNATVKGEYRFSGNRFELMEGFPPLTDARGRVSFTENSLTIGDASARALGEPLRLNATTRAEGGIRFEVAGGIAMRALREQHDWPVLSHLSGSTAWSASIELLRDAVTVRVASGLDGIASSLPAPFNKRATEAWPLALSLDLTERGAVAQLRADLQGRGALDIFRRRLESGAASVRGGVSLFAPLQLAERGLMLSAKLDEFDLDTWRDLIDADASVDEADAPLPGAGLIGAVDVEIARLKVFDMELHAFTLAATADEVGMRGRMSSRRAQGDFVWDDRGGGALQARFERLEIGGDEKPQPSSERDRAAAEPLRRLPSLDIIADQFSLGGMDLGRLELNASNEGALWRLHALTLSAEQGQLRGAGWWRPGATPWTELSFALATDDAGALLDRLGYPAVIDGGVASMEGSAAWGGTPLRIDYPSLSGAIELKASKGQFRKLEPGVGRLLGILSLQSLPRRLTLDFRDVFSEGFAFDLISGSISMDSGVMRTEDLQISGPAAKVWVTGSANVAEETQDLRVIVQPTLSESVAIGAAAGLINPVAGVVALLAQRMLSDPIERMFAFSYAITGAWSNPKVEKISGAAQPAE